MELTLEQKWQDICKKLSLQFDQDLDLQGILFLIGVQELGKGYKVFAKDQKIELMHIAVCTILSASGYYSLEGRDEDGWPHFNQLKALPEYNMIEQENFLKDHVLLYFQNQKFID